MESKYETPFLTIVLLDVDVITTSPTVPDFDEDDNELPKQDW